MNQNNNLSILLQTKLFAPPTRTKLVPRPRLIAKLNSGLDGKLTLISAPAGFGKTTLVRDWLSQTERSFVWVSLDEDDNDLTRFFTYAAAAIQQIDGVGNSIQGLLQASQPVAPKSLVTAFINDCTPVDSPFILTFDDYNTITETAVNEAVVFLVDNLPPQLHLAITSRTDPLLPLPRLRASGQMTELRTDDLRFTAGEAASFLQQVMGLKLSAAEAAALEARTEGWIAGLQMAALSIQGLMSSEEIAAFVADFTGSHRYIFDYLTDEVLRKRPPDTQAFLLQTALLDRFNASLCTAVTGQDNSQAILQTLDRANLFLFPLDEKRQWYRYHHLFADLLRQRLQRRQPELIPDLYQRASQWYAERGEVEKAIHYALEGKDVSKAAQLLEKVALDFIRRSEVVKFVQLVEQLPEDAQNHSPQLCLARAWAFVFAGNFDLAEEYAVRAEMTLIRPDLLTGEFPEVLARATVATIRSFIAFRQDKLPEALALSEEALISLKELPEEQAIQLRGPLLVNLVQTQVALDEIEGAEASYQKALEDCKAYGHSFAAMAAYGNIMNLQRRQGRLAAAKAVGLQGLDWLVIIRQQDDQRVPAEGEIRRELGIICLEQNQLSEAKKHLQIGLDFYRYNSPESFIRCLHYLFLVELAQGKLDTAMHIHQQIEPIQKGLPPVPMCKQAANRCERIRRLSRIQPEVDKWPEELRLWLTTLGGKQEKPLNTRHEAEKLIQACVLAALDQLEASLSILNQLADAAAAASRFGDLIQYRVQQALVLNRLSQRETAVIHLSQAVTLAESNNHLRPFLDEADDLRPLFFQLPVSPYRDKLIALVNQESQLESSPPMTQQVSQPSLTDPLSKRELEVLRLLPTGQTSPQIAAQLYLSNNTVKTHIKNIYGKLNVNSRAEAIERAHTLGLIP